MKFSIKDFFSKCDQIRIWLHLLKIYHFFTVELFNAIYGQTSTREFLTNIICVALTYSEQFILKIMDNLYAFVQVNSKVTK